MYNCGYLPGLPAVGCGVKLQHWDSSSCGSRGELPGNCGEGQRRRDRAGGTCRSDGVGTGLATGRSLWPRVSYSSFLSSAHTGIAFVFLLSEQAENRIDNEWQIPKAGSDAELHNYKWQGSFKKFNTNLYLQWQQLVLQQPCAFCGAAVMPLQAQPLL